jgi:hypothetical protein
MDKNKRTNHTNQTDKGEISLYQAGSNVLLENRQEAEAFFRAERVLRAVFLITDHMSDTESLKRTLRDEVLESFRLVTFIVDTFEVDREDMLKDDLVRSLRIRFASLSALLEVASVSALISASNTKILSKEILALSESDLLRSSSEEGITLDEKFFSVPDFSQKDTKESVKDIITKENSEPSKGHSETIKDTQVSKRTLTGSASGARHAKILKELEAKREVSIKDISDLIPNVNEKTLQRDLKQLVSKGLIEKRGKKRWTTYVLKKSS